MSYSVLLTSLSPSCQELVSPSGPLVQKPGDDDEGRVAASRCSRSGAEVLIQLHEERGLRPGLLQLLLGLLRYQYDSMQVRPQGIPDVRM